MERVGNHWTPTNIVTQLPLANLFPCNRITDMGESLKFFLPPVIQIQAATFQEFLQQQPLSVQSFLANIELYADPFTIMAVLQNAELNYLITDSASLPLHTTYGWVLALDDTHILAEGNRLVLPLA